MTLVFCSPVDKLVERSSHSGVGLTKANCGLPETVSRRCSVRGAAPTGSDRCVTTPLALDDDVLVLLLEDEEVPAEVPRAEFVVKVDALLLDELGVGVRVGVAVRVGVGVGLEVGVLVADGVGVGVDVAVVDGVGVGELSMSAANTALGAGSAPALVRATVIV